MRKNIFVMIGLIGMVLLGTLDARDFKSPHKYKKGQVLSADQLNETLEYIEKAQKSPVGADLVGEWSCTSYNAKGKTQTALDEHNYKNTYTLVNGFFARQDNGDMTISDNGNGTFNITGTKQPFLTKVDHQGTQPYVARIVDGMLVVNFGAGSDLTTGWYEIKKISDSRVKLVFSYQGQNVPEYTCDHTLCDKINIPPETPADAVVSTSGAQVDVTWTDKSTDETQFVIERKVDSDAAWTQIDTVPANTTTYTDQPPSSASEVFYRVKAKNNNGNSYGTNMVKIKK